jgi:hypothetical protein
MPTRKRRRWGSRVRVAGLLLILAVLAAASAAYWLVLHIAVGLGFAVLLAAAVWAGMLIERRRTPRPAPVAAPPAAGWQPAPAPDHHGDQIRDLEDAAGRPIDAVIASYRLIQRKYGART